MCWCHPALLRRPAVTGAGACRLRGVRPRPCSRVGANVVSVLSRLPIFCALDPLLAMIRQIFGSLPPSKHLPFQKDRVAEHESCAKRRAVSLNSALVGGPPRRSVAAAHAAAYPMRALCTARSPGNEGVRRCRVPGAEL